MTDEELKAAEGFGKVLKAMEPSELQLQEWELIAGSELPPAWVQRLGLVLEELRFIRSRAVEADVPALVAEVRRLREQVAGLEKRDRDNGAIMKEQDEQLAALRRELGWKRQTP